MRLVAARANYQIARIVHKAVLEIGCTVEWYLLHMPMRPSYSSNGVCLPQIGCVDIVFVRNVLWFLNNKAYAWRAYTLRRILEIEMSEFRARYIVNY